MTSSTLRAHLERPFRHYATFSGRSGRPEFWLFVLTFFVLTNIAWPIGYGVMKIAGFESHHETARDHRHPNIFENDLDDTDLADFFHDGTEHPIIFKLHRHRGEDGYHLHGSLGPFDHHDDASHHSRGDGDRHFTFDMDYHDKSYAEDGAEILQRLIALGLFIPLLAVGARRLHDTGKTGWWQLFVLIPLAGWLVLLIFFLIEGDKGKNRFGGTVE